MTDSPHPAPGATPCADYVLDVTSFDALTAAIAALPLDNEYRTERLVVHNDYRVGWGNETRCLAITRPYSFGGITPFLLACVIIDARPDLTINDIGTVMFDLHARQRTFRDGHDAIDYYPTITVARRGVSDTATPQPDST